MGAHSIAHAQTDTSSTDTSRYRVAIFSPLYLDSAFNDSGSYRYDKSFPKFINPGMFFFCAAAASCCSSVVLLTSPMIRLIF